MGQRSLRTKRGGTIQHHRNCTTFIRSSPATTATSQSSRISQMRSASGTMELSISAVRYKQNQAISRTFKRSYYDRLTALRLFMCTHVIVISRIFPCERSILSNTTLDQDDHNTILIIQQEGTTFSLSLARKRISQQSRMCMVTVPRPQPLTSPD